MIEKGEAAAAGETAGTADTACSLFAQAGFRCLIADPKRFDSKLGSPFQEVPKF